MRRIGVLLWTLGLIVVAVAPSDGQQPLPTAAPPTAACKPPVLLVDASAALVDALISKKIDRTEPFTDVIKDIPNSGTRRTVGTVHAVLVPDPTHGEVDIVFAGTTVANAVGKRPLTQTYTNTVTAVESTYRVTFNARGLCGARAGAGAGAAITLLDVVDNHGEHDSTAANLVRRGFPQEKREVEGIVTRRAARHAALEQEATITPQLATAGTTLGLAWGKQLGLHVGELEFETSTDYLEVRLPARPTAPPLSNPPPLAANTDFSVRVHQAFLNDVARTGLGGRTFKIGELQRLADQLVQPLLRDGRPDPDRLAGVAALEKLLRGLTGTATALTFAANDPIRFTFAEQGFTVEAHLARIQLDGRALPGMRLRAVYRIVNTAKGVVVQRQGPLDVSADKSAAKVDTVLLAALRTAVGLLGEEIFRARFTVADVARPTGVAAARADSARGWLSVAWKLKASATSRP